MLEVFHKAYEGTPFAVLVRASIVDHALLLIEGGFSTVFEFTLRRVGFLNLQGKTSMKFRFVHRFLFLLFALAATVVPVLAESRVALVIGNSAYKHVAELPNPRNDSSKIAEKLADIGFKVTQADDLGYDALRRTLRDFSRQAAGADMAVVFFAGHGMEVNKSNYLIPTDARLETDREISYEAVPLELVTEAVSGAKGLRLVMLDACRNNPFANKMKMTSPSRSLGRGLSRVEPTAGTLVSYAAKEGTTADDGRGQHSPYTQALLKHLDEPGLEINFLFRKVRDSVLQETGGKQEPFTYGSLPGSRLYLKAAKSKPPQSELKQPGLQLSEAAQVWAVTQGSKSIPVLEAFLEAYKGTPYAVLARARISELKDRAKQQVSSQPAETNTDIKKRADDAVPAIPEEKKIAAIAPEPEPEVVSRFASESDLVRAIQKALNEHRCAAGNVDGKWGKKGFNAVKRFARYAKLTVGTDPSENLLDAIEGKSGKACPLVCGRRFLVKNDKCVLKTCKKGEKLDRRGKCLRVAILDNACVSRCQREDENRCVRGVMANGASEDEAGIACMHGHETRNCRKLCTR